VKDGQRIRLQGQGSNGGDLYLKISIRKDPRYERKDADIFTGFSVPYTVAALGGEASVETPQGRKVLSIPSGTQSGQRFRLTGIGMPLLKGAGRGNLYASAEISVPKMLSPRERELLSELASLRKDDVTVGG
jgi:DnaJ-class molecular chaperone